MMQAARTIRNQAEKLGYRVSVDEAASTRSCYLTCAHDELPDALLIRISDHQPNEARYVYGVNAEPDLCVDEGYQQAAVRYLARRIGRDPETLAYIKRMNTVEARKAAKAEADRRARQTAEERRQAACRWADAHLSDASRAVFAERAGLSGKRARTIRRSARWKRANAEFDALVARWMEENA